MIDGKIYIGQTVDFYRRMNEYRNRKASKSTSSRYSIMKAIEEHGFESFTSEILHECDKEDLDYYEMYYIQKYKSYMKKYGYNSFHKPKGSKKFRMNRSTKSLMSKSHTRLVESSVTKRKKSNQVYAISDELFIICDSAKLLGDYFGKSKDYIKNCLRQPSSLSGFNIYYADYDKRQEIRKKMLQKRSIRNKKYMILLDYLDNLKDCSVETIEPEYTVKILSYDSEVE